MAIGRLGRFFLGQLLRQLPHHLQLVKQRWSNSVMHLIKVIDFLLKVLVSGKEGSHQETLALEIKVEGKAYLSNSELQPEPVTV